MPYLHFNTEDEASLWVAWDSHTFMLAKKHLQIEGVARRFSITPNPDEEISISFYLDYHPDHHISVDGHKASVFRENQKLIILSNGVKIQLSFSSQDGDYCGHIMRGNRPCQHACRGNDLYTSYDWRFGIRTVREGNSPIEFELMIEKDTESQQQLP